MSDVNNLFADVLHKSNNSLTKARLLVFEALVNQGPLTMHELVAKVKDKVDRASVYRCISLFESLGIVHRLQMGWKYKLELTDKFNYHHHHISCSQCGKIVPLREDKILEASVNSIAHEYGFKATHHQIEIQGLCHTCQPTRLN